MRINPINNNYQLNYYSSFKQNKQIRTNLLNQPENDELSFKGKYTATKLYSTVCGGAGAFGVAISAIASGTLATVGAPLIIGVGALCAAGGAVVGYMRDREDMENNN